MKLTNLEPQFMKLTRLEYEPTDDISQAAALRLRCPACHWSFGRHDPSVHVHTMMLWKPDQQLWHFEGHDYTDLSLMAGRIAVTLTTGCRASFWVKKGKVDFA